MQDGCGCQGEISSWIVAHTLLSVVAIFCAGFTVHLFRPAIGYERYSRVAKTPLTVVLLLTIVALWGFLLYARWRDRRAFFAWVLPMVFSAHLLLSREWADLQYSFAWDSALVVLECGAAYSVGAVLGAIVFRMAAKT